MGQRGIAELCRFVPCAVLGVGKASQRVDAKQRIIDDESVLGQWFRL